MTANRSTSAAVQVERPRGLDFDERLSCLAERYLLVTELVSVLAEAVDTMASALHGTPAESPTERTAKLTAAGGRVHELLAELRHIDEPLS